MNMIGNRIKMAMGDTGTTEKQLCDEVGISKVILNKYLDGDRIPHAPIIAKMARVMGVNERWLAGVDNDDLINRQAAIDAVNNIMPTKEGFLEPSEVLCELMQLPSAQANIIACGDFKYWICHDRRCGFWNNGVKPLDWCSYAERRNE